MKLQDLVRKDKKRVKIDLKLRTRRNQPKDPKYPGQDGDGEGDMSGEVDIGNAQSQDTM